MGKLAGFGHKWGLLGDADEDAGILPGPEWMKENDKWLIKDAQHRSLEPRANGQHLHRPGFRPEHAAANGDLPLRRGQRRHGLPAAPLLARRRLQGEDERRNPGEGQVYSTLDVKPSDLKAVQEGMREVVGAEAPATLAQVPGYHMAGKTGTAQAWIKVDGETRRDLKCWFYCYGPFEAPRYVTCVVVEGGTWGATTRRRSPRKS